MVEDAPIVKFSGTWLSDAFDEIVLQQQGKEVAGRYRGRGGGTITGTVRESRLDFTWRDTDTSRQYWGWGFLRAVAAGMTLVGLWGYETEKAQHERLRAVVLECFPPQVDALIQSLGSDKTALRSTAISLAQKRRYLEAKPLLELAVRRYSEEQREESSSFDSQLGDKARILSYLIESYVGLADYRGLPETPRALQYRIALYEKVLEAQRIAVDAYSLLLVRILQQPILSSMPEFNKAIDGLFEFYPYLENQANALEHNPAIDVGEKRYTIIRDLRALAQVMKEGHGYLSGVQEVLRQLGQRRVGRRDQLIEALMTLDATYVATRGHLIDDARKLLTLTLKGMDEQQCANLLMKRLLPAQERVQELPQELTSVLQEIDDELLWWPEPPRKVIEYFYFVLFGLIKYLEGQPRAIAQTISSVEQRVPRLWGSIFRLPEWMEKWRRALLADADKIAAQEQGQAFFHNIIDAYVSLDNGEEALVLSEYARARAIADLLAARLAPSPSPSVPGASLLTSASLLAFMQQRGSVTIEYFVMEHQLVIWLLSSGGEVHMYTSRVSRAELEAQVNFLMQLIEQPKLNASKRRQLSLSLHTLYHCLFASIPQHMLPASADEVVTIIPHGTLFRVPFAALKDAAGHYVLERHTIVYAPSIATLQYMAQRAQQSIQREAPTLLAFVNPWPLPEPALAPLTDFQQGFQDVAAFYSATQQHLILSGEHATKQRLEQEAAHYSVLCLATHAEVDDRVPLQSFIALAQAPPDNGRMSISDILRLDLQTDLVILSACRTARGPVTGDGVTGVSRAFLQAGTPSLLMSLWSIPEGESLDQLYDFHRHWLARGTFKAHALRETQLQRVRYYPDQPDVWAGFILVGEWM